MSIFDFFKRAFGKVWRETEFVRMCFLRVVNFIIPKESNHLLFLPSENCYADKYDITNYGSDNVLTLCNSILHDKRFKDFHLSIAVYSPENLSTYKDYCDDIKFSGRVDFFYYYDKISFFWNVCKSIMIFSANYYNPIKYKVRRQKTVSLGYFVIPFKDDYFKIKRLGYRHALKIEKMRNRVFDYHLSTSELCSRELSVDSLLYLPKYISLGFPRNDIFSKEEPSYREKISAALGYNPKKIMAFVPTHRDYEKKSNYLFDESHAHPHSLFGSVTVEEENKLSDFLEKEDIIIIAKAHPMQDKEYITETSSARIVYFSDLIEKCKINLQEIMAASDMMATDYSTACFDYLLTDRPCIYYFYDYEIECKSRKFFIDPITPVCAGEIVYDIDGFINAINNVIRGNDIFKEKRRLVRDLIFCNQDGNSTERVKEFVLDKTN